MKLADYFALIQLTCFALIRHPDYNPDRAQKLTSSSMSRHLSAGLVQNSQPILLKLGVMIGFTNEKNRLRFIGDLVPDMDSGSLFHSTSLAITE